MWKFFEMLRAWGLQYMPPIAGGFFVGMFFRLVNLPIPAPNVIEGILGIIGIYLGYKLTSMVK